MYQKIIKLFILILICTLSGALGAYNFKMLTSKSDSIKKYLFSYYLYLGGLFYISASFINIYALKFYPYSLVLPLTSVTYVWTLIISKYKLSENITCKKIAGVCLIIIGSFILSFGIK